MREKVRSKSIWREKRYREQKKKKNWNDASNLHKSYQICLVSLHFLDTYGDLSMPPEMNWKTMFSFLIVCIRNM